MNKQHNQQNKFKMSKAKKSCLHSIIPSAGYAKQKRVAKLRKNHKHNKLKHVGALSNYVGAERLTKNITLFSKGKISDSISRLEKSMPREIKARAEQDLKKVLSLTCTKNKEQKHRKKSIYKHANSYKELNIQSSIITPQYLHNKTGFASISWKNKLQKSVGLSSNKSVLASMHEQQCKASPKEILVAQKTLLLKVHPHISDANSVLFPNASNMDKIKRKLLEISNQMNIYDSIPYDKTSYSNLSNSSNTSLANSSQNTKNLEFHLNPIFTGESIEREITEIFPTFDDVDSNDDFTDINCSNSPYVTSTNNTMHDQIPSPINFNSSQSVTLVPSSPTSSQESPAWKLKLSPIKFVPEQVPTPALYFRHKMF